MPGLVSGMAKLLEIALIAFGFAGDADLAAVVDDLVGEIDPAVLGDNLHQFLLHFLGCVAFGEAKAMGDAEDVGIDNHALGFLEAHSENHIRSLPRRARDGDQLGQGLRDLALEIRNDLAGCALNGFCLVVVEAGGADKSFEFGQCRLRHGCGGGEPLEQCRRDNVDANVSALGRENCGYQQFPGRAVVEGALHVWVGLIEALENGGDTIGSEISARRIPDGLFRCCLDCRHGCFSWLRNVRTMVFQKRNLMRGTSLMAARD